MNFVVIICSPFVGVLFSDVASFFVIYIYIYYFFVLLANRYISYFDLKD